MGHQTQAPASRPVSESLSTPSLFGSSGPASKSSTTPSLFSPSEAPFKGSTSPSLFGSSGPTSKGLASPSLFSSSGPTSEGPTSPSLFASSGPASTSSTVPSIFGSSVPASKSPTIPSIFSSSGPAFQSSTAPSIFGSSVQTPKGSTTPSLFGSPWTLHIASKSSANPFIFQSSSAPHSASKSSTASPLFGSSGSVSKGSTGPSLFGSSSTSHIASESSANPFAFLSSSAPRSASKSSKTSARFGSSGSAFTSLSSSFEVDSSVEAKRAKLDLSSAKGVHSESTLFEVPRSTLNFSTTADAGQGDSSKAFDSLFREQNYPNSGEQKIQDEMAAAPAEPLTSKGRPFLWKGIKVNVRLPDAAPITSEELESAQWDLSLILGMFYNQVGSTLCAAGRTVTNTYCFSTLSSSEKILVINTAKELARVPLDVAKDRKHDLTVLAGMAVCSKHIAQIPAVVESWQSILRDAAGPSDPAQPRSVLTEEPDVPTTMSKPSFGGFHQPEHTPETRHPPEHTTIPLVVVDAEHAIDTEPEVVGLHDEVAKLDLLKGEPAEVSNEAGIEAENVRSQLQQADSALEDSTSKVREASESLLEQKLEQMGETKRGGEETDLSKCTNCGQTREAEKDLCNLRDSLNQRNQELAREREDLVAYRDENKKDRTQLDKRRTEIDRDYEELRANRNKLDREWIEVERSRNELERNRLEFERAKLKHEKETVGVQSEVGTANGKSANNWWRRKGN